MVPSRVWVTKNTNMMTIPKCLLSEKQKVVKTCYENGREQLIQRHLDRNQKLLRICQFLGETGENDCSVFKIALSQL